ncbi:flavodoxin family protein [Marasmitruncus massiliensis]|uniref:flavodoxin family protein n=1 Tax=Marasmitruncus massiliensis TaxID=1944642 RepID=UPI000C7BE666|nr:flavodoxin [Marasmitruncus massiliensis]
MKSIVVFYSLEGNTRMIAQAIAKETEADLLELRPKQEIPKKGFRKFFWGGKSVVFREQPDLENEFPDFAEYDTVLIGTPVWAGSFAAPVNTFLKTQKLEGKKIALFACHKGGGTKKCFEDFKKNLPGCKFLGELSLVDPLVRNPEENRQKTIEWVRSLNLA